MSLKIDVACLFPRIIASSNVPVVAVADLEHMLCAACRACTLWPRTKNLLKNGWMC